MKILVLVLFSVGFLACGSTHGGPETIHTYKGNGGKGSPQDKECKTTKPNNEIFVEFQFTTTITPRHMRVKFWHDVVYDECDPAKTKFEYRPIVARRGNRFVDMKAIYPNDKNLPKNFASSVKSVGEWRLGQLSKAMI